MSDNEMQETALARSPFDTQHLKTDLKGRSVRGGTVTIVGQSLRFVIQTFSTMILARLLAPADFGLIAMVAAIVGFAALFKDLGLSMATIQKDEITHEQVSMLFWINVIFSGLIAAAIVALSPAISWFYGEPRLTLVSVSLSIVFLFDGLTVQHQAILRRQMRFTALATIQVISTSAGVIAAIVSAMLGSGYWALVIMQGTSVFVFAIAVWLTTGWVPGLPTRHAGVRSMLEFGANLTGFNILNYFARNLDNVLIGKAWGAKQLGFYSKAYGLLLLPINQITAPVASVAIPVLSRLQSKHDEYIRYYYRAINLIAFITMPLIMLLTALPREIILIILGAQWVDAASIFRVLGFGALFQPVVNPTGWVYISFGQTNRMMHWGFFSVPIIIVSFIAGLPWGALGVAVSYTICSLSLLTLPCLWWAFRHSPLTVSQWFKAVQRPLITSLILYASIEILRNTIRPINPIKFVGLAGLLGLFVFVMVMVFWRGARVEALRDIRLLSSLKSQLDR